MPKAQEIAGLLNQQLANFKASSEQRWHIQISSSQYILSITLRLIVWFSPRAQTVKGMQGFQKQSNARKNGMIYSIRWCQSRWTQISIQRWKRKSQDFLITIFRIWVTWQLISHGLNTMALSSILRSQMSSQSGVMQLQINSCTSGLKPVMTIGNSQAINS